MVKQDCKFPAVRSEAVSEAEACPETGKSMQLRPIIDRFQLGAYARENVMVQPTNLFEGFFCQMTIARESALWQAWL